MAGWGAYLREGGERVRWQPRTGAAEPSCDDHLVRPGNRIDAVRHGRNPYHRHPYLSFRGPLGEAAFPKRQQGRDRRWRGRSGPRALGLLAHVRELDKIFVSSLYYEDAKKLARLNPLATPVRSLEKAIASSDIICLCTHSPQPVIDPRWIRPGTHISSVGFRPPIGELPHQLAKENRLFVETRDAFKPAPIGCSELTGLDPLKAVELGEIVSGTRAGRIDDDEITVYKAMGIALEDMVAADIAYKTALQTGRGTRLLW